VGRKSHQGVLENVAGRTALFVDPSNGLVFHYTVQDTSRLNQIEIGFGILARKVIRRGQFQSKEQLKQKLEAFIKYFNRTMV